MGIPRKVPGRGSVGMGLGSGVIGQLTLLQLNTFHALWNLYEPSSERNQLPAPDAITTRGPKMSRWEALGRFPIGTKVIKPYEDGKGISSRPGHVYDFYSPYWRVRFSDNDWEELTASEMKIFRV